MDAWRENQREGFNLDWEMFGDLEEELQLPRPFPDSPPHQQNPRQPGYRSPSTSRVIAGAGMEGMGEEMDDWGRPQATGPTMQERLDAMAQQMAQMHDENVQLRDDLMEL